MPENGFYRPNRDFLVTETPIDIDVDLSKLMAYLRFQRTTGTLTFHFNQGGIREILLYERTRATMEQRRKMREILGMK